MRPSEVGTKPCTAQPIDRLAIPALCVLAFAEQRPAARMYPQPPVTAAGARRLGQSLERLDSEPGFPGSRGRLDQLGKRPRGDPQLRRVLDRLLGL